MKSLRKAHYVNGETKVSLARKIGVNVGYLYHWFGGRQHIPKHRRQSVDRAFGASVDWAEYDREYAEAQTAKKLSERAVQPRKHEIAPQPPENTPKPASAAHSAPAAKSGSFWDKLIYDDTGEAAHAV